jgi:hypothetical protein
MQAFSRKRLRLVSACAVAVAAVLLVLLVPVPPVVRAIGWSAVLLASFLGWGSVVEYWLTRGAARVRADWGLRGGWGMALFVISGGFLCLLHFAVRPVLIGHVGLGVAAFAIDGVHRWRGAPSLDRMRRRAAVALGRAGVVAMLVGVAALTVLTFLAFLGFHSFQPSDDPPFYFMLAEKLTQTGSMFEPFAVRRVSLFGGNVYLHAAFISGASIYYLHVVDAGISFVVVVGLLLGYVQRCRPRAWHAVQLALVMVLLFTLQDVRVNTNSEVSGVAMILTLYRTLAFPLSAEGERPYWPIEPRRLVALGGLVLVATLLRISNAPAAMLFVGLAVGSHYLLGTRTPLRRESLLSLARGAGSVAAAFVVGLLPWAILQKHCSGTFFYPFGHSNVTPGWTFLVTPANLGEEGTELLMHLFFGRPVAYFPLFVVAGLVPLVGRQRNDLVALSLAAFLGLAVFSHTAVAFGPNNTARYYYAFVAAASLVIVASAGPSLPRSALVATALALHLSANRDEIKSTLDAYVTRAYAALHDNDKERESFDGLTAEYTDVQSRVPAGKTMATAVFEGFRWDFKRNTVYALDVLGGMGPKPGWPAREGPAALAEYLRTNGVQYLVWVDWNLPSQFYNRSHWRSHLSNPRSYLQGEAVLQLDAEDAIEKLTAMRHVVYQAHGMTVVDLDSPP